MNFVLAAIVAISLGLIPSASARQPAAPFPTPQATCTGLGFRAGTAINGQPNNGAPHGVGINGESLGIRFFLVSDIPDRVYRVVTAGELNDQIYGVITVTDERENVQLYNQPLAQAFTLGVPQGEALVRTEFCLFPLTIPEIDVPGVVDAADSGSVFGNPVVTPSPTVEPEPTDDPTPTLEPEPSTHSFRNNA